MHNYSEKKRVYFSKSGISVFYIHFKKFPSTECLSINIILLNNNACTFSIVSKINKMYECFANTFLLTCHKCHIKTFTREGETRERHAKKVKRQKLYKYTFIISTGCSVKKQ